MNFEDVLKTFADNNLRPGFWLGIQNPRPFTKHPPIDGDLVYQDVCDACGIYIRCDVFQFEDGHYEIYVHDPGPEISIHKCNTMFEVLSQLLNCVFYDYVNTTARRVDSLFYVYDSDVSMESEDSDAAMERVDRYNLNRVTQLASLEHSPELWDEFKK